MGEVYRVTTVRAVGAAGWLYEVAENKRINATRLQKKKISDRRGFIESLLFLNRP
jgi:hypothetical protein